MSVLVCFHAHPDDEVMLTGGVMRQAADAGHRVVLVTATDGALGEVPDGVLDPGETLAQRRRRELEASANVLGAQRVVMLGYGDSGMAGTPENADPAAFCNVDVETAAARLAAVLAEESADVLTVYDPHGGYGHPDHVQVHHVGVRAAELAGVEHVYEAAISRDHLRRVLAAHPDWAPEDPEENPEVPGDRKPTDGEQDGERPQVPDLDSFGLPDSEITTIVDVRDALPAKRAAMLAHESQIGDFGPFLQMSGEQLETAFGTEWFRRCGAPDGWSESSLPL